MLLQENFAEEHIRELQRTSRRDPVLLERAVYAFGLLEALAKVGMPFIFKGGTCLMLLMKHPRRLSTDIDIIAEPGTDLDKYLDRASEIFPFKAVEEQKRIGKNNIEKDTLSSPMIPQSITDHSTFFWMFCLNTIITQSWFKKKFRMIFF